MGVSETSFNRKKVNYIARKRTKLRQVMSHITPVTIDAKKARQIKLFNRKQAKKEAKLEAKRQLKDGKMDTTD